MSDISVNLTPTSLDVYGGPASIDVSLDYGPQGERGSKIFIGNGNPEEELEDEDVKIGDFFINTLQGDPFYGWLYAYVPSVTGAAWETALALDPSQHSEIKTETFNNDGIATLLVPIRLLTKETEVLQERFTIRYNIENEDSNPIASSFEYELATANNEQNVQITISAIKYSGSTWSKLTGTHKVHLFISYQS
jgi:hypothetical protein